MGIIGVIASSDRSVPNAPTIGTATAGNAQATVTFTAPTYTGRLPITSYTVTSSPGSITASGASSPITVTGLSNGTPYTFTVTATNSVGTSAASAASNSVTPVSPVASFWSIVNTGQIFTGAYADSNALYFTGYGNASSGSNQPLVLFSYSRSGSLNWQRQLQPATNWSLLNGECIGDSSGNIYAVTYYVNSAGSVFLVTVAKYDSSGTISWQKSYTNTIGNMSNGGISIDSSNNLYLGTIRQGGTGNYLKIDSTGAYQFGRTSFQVRNTNVINTAVRGTDLMVSTANSEVVGKGGEQAFFGEITKWDLSGNASRRVYYGEATGGGQVYPRGGVAIDSSVNVFPCGWRNYLGALYPWIGKFSSLLGRTASIYFSGYNGGNFQDIKVDSSNNIYVLGNNSQTNGNLIVAKLNNSLTVQWIRTITINPGGYTQSGARRMFLDESNSRLIISGYGNNSLFAAYLPMDGSGTGTYTVGSASIVYAAGNSTTTTQAEANTVGAYTNTNPVNLTIANTTFTGSTPTFTPSTTTF